MNVNINADKLIKAIKENPVSILIIGLFLIALFFGYLFHSERTRATAFCDTELESIQRKFNEYQIQCNEDLLRIRRECRVTIDSIENDYYVKFSRQEKQIIRIESELDRIKGELNRK